MSEEDDKIERMLDKIDDEIIDDEEGEKEVLKKLKELGYF